MTDDLTIRPPADPGEFQQIEQVQRAAWGMATDTALVPAHLLITAARHGGLVLAAFTPAGWIAGFVFGFLGLADADQARWLGTNLLHCSHMMGVRPEFQTRGVGYRLKLAQRERLLAQGLKLAVWTYDPLLSLNARLNVGRLGAIARRYLPDLYGEIPEELNAGLPSDRFEVEWWLTSGRVRRHLAGRPDAPPESAPALNAAVERPDGLRAPADRVLDPGAPVAQVEIPGDFYAIKRADRGLARAWRDHTRAVFTRAFERGYVITGFASRGDGPARRSFYTLTRGPDIAAMAEGRDED